MEYGILPKIDQFSDNKALEIQKVQASSKSSEITTSEELQQIQQEAISKQKDIADAKKVETNPTPANNKYEVVLTNLNFGFNDASRDFYVKAIRGTSENQYPTEDMMRLKAYLISHGTAS